MKYFRQYGKNLFVFLVIILLPYLAIGLAPQSLDNYRGLFIFIVFVLELIIVFIGKISTNKFIWEITREDVERL